MKKMFSIMCVLFLAQLGFSVDYTINSAPVTGTIADDSAFEVYLKGHEPGKNVQINMKREGMDDGPGALFSVHIYVGTNADPITMSMVEESESSTFLLAGSWVEETMRFLFFDLNRTTTGEWTPIDVTIEILGEEAEEVGEMVYFTTGNQCLQFNTVSGNVSNPSLPYLNQTVVRCAGYTTVNSDGVVQRTESTPNGAETALYEGIEAQDLSHLGDKLYAADGDGKVYSYGVSGWSQYPIGGTATSIDVDNDGTIWAVMDFGAVSKKSPKNSYWLQSWDSNGQLEHGTATDIGAGNGKVWVVAAGTVYEQTASNYWEERAFPGTAVRIDVSQISGTPWVIDSSGALWQYNGSSWISRESETLGKTDLAF